jgi:thymidine kinase
MFLEPSNKGKSKGWIEVICGCMFSGKTEELIRRVNRAIIARQRIVIFKPSIDVRYDDIKVVSHNRNSVNSVVVQHPQDMLVLANDADVIAVDEAQFFDEALLEVLAALAYKGKRIIVSGLDMDFEGKPFGVMPQLIAMAEFVTKIQAICVCCGEPASFSFRLNNLKQQILVGEKDEYEPRCRVCFNQGMKEKETAKHSKYKKIELESDF